MDVNIFQRGGMSFPIFWKAVLCTTKILAFTNSDRISIITLTYFINNFQTYGDVQTDYGQRDFKIYFKPVMLNKILTIEPDRVETDDTSETIFFTAMTEFLITKGGVNN